MSRWGRLEAAVPLALGLLAVGGLTYATPDPDYDHRVSWSEGGLGEPVGVPRITVRASEPRVSQSALAQFGDDVLRTEDVLVAVDLEVDVHLEQALPTISLYTTDGRYYDDRFEGSSPDSAPPGFTTSGTSLFLLPAEQVPGAVLRVTPTTREPTNHVVGVSVDLQLGSVAEVRAEAEAAPSLELRSAEVVVT